jgi:hypothetical protein
MSGDMPYMLFMDNTSYLKNIKADLAPLGAFLSFFLRFFLPFLSTVASALRLPVAFLLLLPLLSFADACYMTTI